jgi:hypothetical protein
MVLVGSLRDQLEDLGVNKIIKFIRVCKKCDGCTDWIEGA